MKREVEDSGATRRRKEREIGERTVKRTKCKGRGCGHVLRGWVKFDRSLKVRSERREKEEPNGFERLEKRQWNREGESR